MLNEYEDFEQVPICIEKIIHKHRDVQRMRVRISHRMGNQRDPTALPCRPFFLSRRQAKRCLLGAERQRGVALSAQNPCPGVTEDHGAVSAALSGLRGFLLAAMACVLGMPSLPAPTVRSE